MRYLSTGWEDKRGLLGIRKQAPAHLEELRRGGMPFEGNVDEEGSCGAGRAAGSRERKGKGYCVRPRPSPIAYPRFPLPARRSVQRIVDGAERGVPLNHCCWLGGSKGSGQRCYRLDVLSYVVTREILMWLLFAVSGTFCRSLDAARCTHDENEWSNVCFCHTIAPRSLHGGSIASLVVSESLVKNESCGVDGKSLVAKC